MGTKAEVIKTLVNESVKKDCTEMTHLVATVGDGNMQKGFNRLANFFTAEGIEKGIKLGEKSGFIKGAAVIGIAWGAVEIGKQIVKRTIAKKKHEADGDVIIEKIKEAAIDKEINNDDKNEIKEVTDTVLDHECHQCGKIAHNVDEITMIFGYKESDKFELTPEAYCKECRGDQ